MLLMLSRNHAYVSRARTSTTVHLKGQLVAMYSNIVFQDDTITLSEWPAPESPGPCVANGTIFLRMHPMKGIACNTDVNTFDGQNTFQFTGVVDRGTNGSEMMEGHTSLCMASGIYKTSLSESVAATRKLDIDLVALRNDSHCCMQTVKAASGSRQVEHIVRAPNCAIVERAHVLIRHMHGKTIPCLVVEARLAGERVVYSCAYWSPDGAEVLGVEPRSSTDPRVSSIIQIPDNGTAYMLHAIAKAGETSVEVCEAIISSHFRPTDGSTIHSRIRSLHSLQWSKLWGVGFVIEGSEGSDPLAIRQTNIHLATSTYRLLCTLKTPYDTTRRLKTDSGSHLSEYNTHPVAVASTLMLVPWASWTFALPKVSSWAPLHALATAVVDTLAMYRVTLDRTKLELRWSSVRDIVDYIISRVDADGELGFMHTLSKQLVTGDTFTFGVMRRALDAAEQICNTLRIPSDPAWSEVRGTLSVPRRTDFSLAFKEIPVGHNDGLMLLHPALLPTYAHLTDLGQHAALLEDNREMLEVSASTTPPTTSTFASITTLSAMAQGLASASEARRAMDKCASSLLAASSHVLDPTWGATSNGSTHHAAEILSTVGYGFTGLRIQGHTSRDGVHIVPNALVSGPRTSILPTAWSVVRRFSSICPRKHVENITQNSAHPGFVAT